MSKTANFFDLKKRVKIKDLLDHYDIPYSEAQHNELHADCPFCEAKAFKANTEKNAWICFGDEECGKGNILDFVMKQENCGLKKAGLLLDEWFPDTEEKPEPKKPVKTRYIENAKKRHPHNPPLKLRLELDPQKTHFKEETARHFGGGYCKRGVHRGKVAVPIHNVLGELVAYAGVDRGEMSFPKTYVNNIDVYNLFRIKKRTVRLVETINDVWRDYENGLDSICLFSPLEKAHIYQLDRYGIKALRLAYPISDEDLKTLVRYFFVRLPVE